MKKIKKIITMLLVVVMVLGLLPTTLIPTKVAAADDITDYVGQWPITGAQYTVYTTESAAKTARDNVKNGLEPGIEGIATDINGNNAVFTVSRTGNSQTLSFFAGTYYVVETKVPKGWNADETVHTMKITPNGTAQDVDSGLVSSKETPRFFKFSIEKNVAMTSTVYTAEEYKAKYPIAGAKYALFTTKADADAVAAQMDAAQENHVFTLDYDESKVARDEEGNLAILTTLENGRTNKLWLDSKTTYYMVEVTRPAGYQFDHSVQTVSSNVGNVSVTAESAENPAYIKIKVIKRWAKDAWVQDVNPDNYNLEVTWVLYKEDQTTVVATGTTDKNGNMVGDPIEVPLGNYYVVETGVGENSGKLYVDEEGTISSATITSVAADEFTTKEGKLTNSPIDPKWSIVLTKVIDENDESYYSNFVLKGTQFTVYYLTDPSLTEDQVLATNDDGVVVASDYTKTNAVRTWVFEATDNDQIWKTVTLDDGSMIPIPMNTIYYDNEHLVSGDPIFMEEGPDAQPIMLIGTYVFEETRTTTGLSKMDSWKWSLTNNSTDTEFTYSDINRYNEELAIAANNKQTITIKIKKASDNDDKPNYYGSLQGAQFKLEYQDPVTSEWKPATAMDINNTTVDVSVLTTDADGNASSVPMKPGTYRLTELVAPRGHVLMNDQGDAAEIGKPFVLGAMGVENNGKRNFEFYYDYSSNPDLENKTTYVIFDKLGYSENGNIEFVTGATLQLWELDADKNPVTQLKVNDQLNFVTTGERIELYGLTVGTSYRFIEIAAPEGYLLPEGEAAYVDFTVPNSTDPVMLQLENERVPKLRSEARTVDGVKEQLLGTDATINDHFWISDLLPNKHYRFEGKLVDASNPDNVIATQVSEFNTDSVKTEVDVVFTFNSADLEGKTLVVIGELFRDGRSTKVATHYDLADFNESIVIPTIGTFAFDKDKAEDHVYASYILNSGTGVVSDRIDYERLIAGTTYEVETKLVDEAGNVVKTIDGTEITKYRFDAETDNGSIVVETKFNALENQGKTLTVYEYIYSFNDNYEKVLIAQHEDLTDTKQQITVPEIKTTASEEVITAADNEEDYKFVVTDYVEYNHLPANTTFVGIATVMNPETNEALVDENGNTFTVETEFTTDDTGAGNYSVTIEIPYSLIEGKDIVMFEEVKDSENAVSIAHHIDWEDKNQTVEFPEIKTSAWFIEDDTLTKNGLKDADSLNLVDKVTLTNLEKDVEYVINAEIYVVKADGTYELVVKSNDVTYTGLADEFELVDVPFENVVFPETDENSKFVIMEYLYANDVLIGKHFNTADDEQTIRVSDFHTTAVDKADNDKYFYNSGSQTVVDVFHYDNLTPGVEVRLDTYLVDENGNELKDEAGNRISVETVFTPEETSGDITIEITVDAKFFEGQIITVFEDLYENDVLVGMHHDLSQESQTVYVPGIKTTASYVENKDEEKHSFDLIDVVDYKNFPVGSNMIIYAKLMDVETQEIAKDAEGNDLVVRYELTPEVADGTYEIRITVPVDLVKGKTFVFFETAYELVDDEEVLFADHEDWEDEDQTLYIPEIRTNAELANTVIGEDGKINIIDTITYTNLKVGVEYTFVGTLMDLATNEELKDSEGNPVQATATFTPEEANGTIEVIFAVDEADIVGHEVVVFERAYTAYATDDEELIGTHEDWDSEDQTVEVPVEVTVSIFKVDSKNEKVLLKGAEITVFKKDGTVAIDKYGKECIGLTDDNGEITFILLKSKDDEYYVQETKAPAGYHININQFEIDLSENTNYRVDIDVHINDMAIIIPPVNTGDNNHLILWIAILSGALLAAGGACFFIFKKKKKADA